MVDAVRHLFRLALLVLQVGGIENVLSKEYVTTMPWYHELPSILAGESNNGAGAKVTRTHATRTCFFPGSTI